MALSSYGSGPSRLTRRLVIVLLVASIGAAGWWRFQRMATSASRIAAAPPSVPGAPLSVPGAPLSDGADQPSRPPMDRELERRTYRQGQCVKWDQRPDAPTPRHTDVVA